MHTNRIRIFRLSRPLFHFLIILVVFTLTYYLRMWEGMLPRHIPLINVQELKLFAVISAVIFVARGLIKHLYELNKTADNYIKTLSKVWMYRAISITFVSYFGQGVLFMWGISRFVIISTALFAYLFLFLFDQVRYTIDYKLQKKMGKKILIVSNNLLDSGEVITKIQQSFSFPTEFIEQKDIETIDFSNYSIAVALGNFGREPLQLLFEKTRFYDTRFFHISEGYFLEDVVYKPENIDTIIAMEYRHSQLDGRSVVLKRIFDLIGASVGMIIALPVMLIIAVIIKLDSSGPVIYKSKRVWKGWKVFTFYKFRSMYTHLSVGYGGKKADELYQKLIDSDANNRKGILPKIKNDPRITRVGRFLRKTSLDELPQLFQIITGQMSLVWPRPHLPEEVAKYEPRMKRVLSIKPWITWYSQVFGRDHLPFEEEAKLELYYIQNWSLAMDLYVIFATFGVVFKGR